MLLVSFLLMCGMLGCGEKPQPVVDTPNAVVDEPTASVAEEPGVFVEERKPAVEDPKAVVSKPGVMEEIKAGDAPLGEPSPSTLMPPPTEDEWPKGVKDPVDNAFKKAFARKWTDVTGRGIEAELLEVKDGRVFLKRKDGKVGSVPIERLSEADQKFVRSQVASEAATPSRSPSGKRPAKDDNRAGDKADGSEKTKAPSRAPWQTDPIAFAQMFFGEDLSASKTTGDVTYPDTTKKAIAGKSVTFPALVSEFGIGEFKMKNLIVPFCHVKNNAGKYATGHIAVFGWGETTTEKITRDAPVGSGCRIRLKVGKVDVIRGKYGVPMLTVTGEVMEYEPLPNKKNPSVIGIGENTRLFSDKQGARRAQLGELLKLVEMFQSPHSQIAVLPKLGKRPDRALRGREEPDSLIPW